MGEQALHRCLVKQKDDHTRSNCYRMVTRTDVIRFLLRHDEEFQGLFDSSLKELGLGTEVPISAYEEATALEVYQKYG